MEGKKKGRVVIFGVAKRGERRKRKGDSSIY